MDFRGLVYKRVWKITFFGLKSGQDLKNRAAHPHQEFAGLLAGKNYRHLSSWLLTACNSDTCIATVPFLWKKNTLLNLGHLCSNFEKTQVSLGWPNRCKFYSAAKNAVKVLNVFRRKLWLFAPDFSALTIEKFQLVHRTFNRRRFSK